MKKDEITLEGESIESFEDNDIITEIILIGKYGGIRRVMLLEEREEGVYRILKP